MIIYFAKQIKNNTVYLLYLKKEWNTKYYLLMKLMKL